MHEHFSENCQRQHVRVPEQLYLITQQGNACTNLKQSFMVMATFVKNNTMGIKHSSVLNSFHEIIILGS